MTFKFDYKLTRKAETDLDETIAYIAVTLANPKAAADFLDKLTQIISELRSFPKRSSMIFGQITESGKDSWEIMSCIICRTLMKSVSISSESFS